MKSTYYLVIVYRSDDKELHEENCFDLLEEAKDYLSLRVKDDNVIQVTITEFSTFQKLISSYSTNK